MAFLAKLEEKIEEYNFLLKNKDKLSEKIKSYLQYLIDKSKEGGIYIISKSETSRIECILKDINRVGWENWITKENIKNLTSFLKSIHHNDR